MTEKGQGLSKEKAELQKLLDSLKEVIPKTGEPIKEKKELSEILCKPKILPLKSLTLQKLEEMEKDMIVAAKGGGLNG